MSALFAPIEELPRRNATQVKNKWGDLVREVRAFGSVAVTSHEKVEMVVIDAGHYQEIIALAEGVAKRDRAALSELAAEFDQRLAALKARGVRKNLDAAVASKGRVRPRPKAGLSF